MYDTDDRIENFKLTYNYIRHIFPEVQIIISEYGKEKKFCNLIQNEKNIDYIFLQDESPYIKKCKIINDAVELVSTPYFILNDSDCIVDVRTYTTAENYLEHGFDLVVTHNNDTVEVKNEYKNLIKDFKWDFSQAFDLDHSRSYKEVGGIVSFNTANFIKAGMMNENFDGWGCEDLEIIVRFQKLGFSILTGISLPFHLVHLVHKSVIRGIGSARYQHNLKEYLRVKDMKIIALLEEIKDWSWTSYK